MRHKREVINSGTKWEIVNNWDDCHSEQFLLIHHPNGTHCDVVIMAGVDYGGGVDSYFTNVPICEIDKLMKEIDSPYDLYIAVRDGVWLEEKTLLEI